MPLDERVRADELDVAVRRDLGTLAPATADIVARHLVMTGRLLPEDPGQALVHAQAATALAGRVAAVREAAGLAAYAAGQWATALAELRAARRLDGRAEHLAVTADCQRGLGRPERALEVLDDPAATRLPAANRVELLIVVAAARCDLGESAAGALLLQGPARAADARRPWAARLWYAYADCLVRAGRPDSARAWFHRAAQHDPEGETDATDRLLDLDGVVLEDVQDDGSLDEPTPGDTAGDLPDDLDALVAGVPGVRRPDRGDRGSHAG